MDDMAFTVDDQIRGQAGWKEWIVTTSQDGNVYLLQHADSDGRADSRTTFASGYYFPVGVTIHNPTGDVYVSYQGKITVLNDTNGDSYGGEASWFVRFPCGSMPLPLLFGQDEALYVGDYINNAIYRISYGMPE